MTPSPTSLIGPRYYTLRTVQGATWALWIFGVLSIALFGGVLARLAIQGMGVLSVSRSLSDARADQVALDRDLKAARIRGSHTGAPSVRTIPAVAAEMERTARRLGVTLLAFAPDEAESELPADQSPGETFTATAQKVTVRASGPYRSVLQWVRSSASGDLPVKVEAITLSPTRAARGPTTLAVDLELSFYSVKKKAAP